MGEYSVTLAAEPERVRGLRRELAAFGALAALLLALVVWITLASRPSRPEDWRWSTPLFVCAILAAVVARHLWRGFRLARWLDQHEVTLDETGLVVAGRHGEPRRTPWKEVTGVAGDSPGLALFTRQGRLILIPEHCVTGNDFLLALRVRFLEDGIGGRTRLRDVSADLITVVFWMALLFTIMALPARLLLPSLSTMSDPADRHFGLLGLIAASGIAAVTGGVIGGMRFSRVWQAMRVWGGLPLPMTVWLPSVLWCMWALSEWGTRSALGLGAAVGVLGAAASEVALRISVTRQWGVEHVAREIGAVPLPEGARIRPLGLWNAIKAPLLLAYVMTNLAYGSTKLWGVAHTDRHPVGSPVAPYLLGAPALLFAWFFVRTVTSAWCTSFRISADGLEVWDGQGRRIAVAWNDMVLMEFAPSQGLIIHYRAEEASDGERQSGDDGQHGEDDSEGEADEGREDEPTRWLVFHAERWKGGLLSQLMRVVQDRAGLTEVVQLGRGFYKSEPITVLRFARPGYCAPEDEERPEDEEPHED